MNKEHLQKKLNETNQSLEKLKSIFLQITGQKSLLEELIKEEEKLEENKDGNNKT